MAQWKNIKTKEYKVYNKIETPPEGSTLARVCAILDVGTHESWYQNERMNRHLLWLGFELAERDSSGSPFYMSLAHTLSLSTNSHLYKIVVALHGSIQVGEAFDTDWLENKPCVLKIVHEVKTKDGKERRYANIASISEPLRSSLAECPRGSCVIWRVSDRTSCPNVACLPPLWHAESGQMLGPDEWADLSEECQGPRRVSQEEIDRLKETRETRKASDSRMPAGNSGRVSQPERDVTPSRVQPVTQEEADASVEVPF